MARTANTTKNYEALAAKAPTQLHQDFAEWIYVQTGVKVDLKTVQLVTTLRMDFQASPENQAKLAERKASAAAKKKASAERKKAKLQAELAKLKGEAEAPVVEKSEADKAWDEAFETVRAKGGDHDEAAEAGKRAKDKVEAAEKVDNEPSKLTVLYGNGEPEVHKFGCADLKKYTRAKGFTKETVIVASHTELTENIYADMIGSGEATVQECSGGYGVKPCCPALND